MQADFEGDIQEIVNREFERCFDQDDGQVDILKDLSDRVEMYQDQISNIFNKIDDMYEVQDINNDDKDQMQKKINFLEKILDEQQSQKYKNYLSGTLFEESEKAEKDLEIQENEYHDEMPFPQINRQKLQKRPNTSELDVFS